MTTSQTRSVCGLSIPLIINFSVRYEDQSFDHEFGTERCGIWTLDEVELIEADCDLKEEVVEAIRARCPVISRKKLLRQSRRWREQIEQALRGDAGDILDMDALETFINENTED